MRLNDQIQVKIQRIRKNIFNDVLKYNQEVADQKRYQRRVEKQHQQQQFEVLTQRELDSLRQEQEETYRNKQRQKQHLKKQHERQMRQKKRKEEQEKRYDSAYADIQKSYLQFKNERRMQDLKRMFNRKSYRASLAESSKRRARTQLDNSEDHSAHNYSYGSQTPKNGRYENVSAQKYNERQQPKHQYQDSLDNIRIKPKLEYQYNSPAKGESVPIKQSNYQY